MLKAHNNKQPMVERNVFIADGSIVIGDVELRENSSVWYNAVLRGDTSKIIVGKNSNIQDNCTVHADFGTPVTIGDNVTIGHNAIIHSCTIEGNCLIGMGATILDEAVIGKGSIVGANALVTGRTIIPPNSLVLGSPAKVVKEINSNEDNIEHALNYVKLANTHSVD